MRITNNMMVTSTIRNINASANRLNEATERMSTQLKISLPSDDPVVATKTIKYRDYVAKIEQYQSNASAASSWQKTTDDALSSLYDYIADLKEDVSKAASASMTTSDWADIKEKVQTALESVVQVMNADYGGRYIFGGYDVSEEPYKLVERMPTEVNATQGAYTAGSISLSNELPTGNSNVNVSLSGGTYTLTMTDSNGTTYTGTTPDAYSTVELKAADGKVTATLTAPSAGYANGDAFSFTAGECALVTYKGQLLSTVMSGTADDTEIKEIYGGNTYVDKGGNESIKYDLGYGADVTVNTEGQDVIGDSTSNLFNSITKLLLALSAADTTNGTTYKVYDPATVTGFTAGTGTYDAAELGVSDGLASGSYSVNVAAGSASGTYAITLTAASSGNTYTTMASSATDPVAFTVNGATVTLTPSASSAYAAGDGFAFTVGDTVTTETISNIDELLDDFATDLDRLTTAQAALGARMTYVNNVSDRLANDETNYTSLLSNTIDVDVSEASLNQSSAETVYEAALAVGAKAISKTLVDFMA